MNENEGIFSTSMDLPPGAEEPASDPEFASWLENQGSELSEAIAAQAAAVATATVTETAGAVKGTTGVLANMVRWASAHKVLAGSLALLGVYLISRRRSARPAPRAVANPWLAYTPAEVRAMHLTGGKAKSKAKSKGKGKGKGKGKAKTKGRKTKARKSK